MKKSSLLAFALVALLALTITSCKKDNDITPSDQKGTTMNERRSSSILQMDATIQWLSATTFKFSGTVYNPDLSMNYVINTETGQASNQGWSQPSNASSTAVYDPTTNTIRVTAVIVVANVNLTTGRMRARVYGEKVNSNQAVHGDWVEYQIL